MAFTPAANLAPFVLFVFTLSISPFTSAGSRMGGPSGWSGGSNGSRGSSSGYGVSNSSNYGSRGGNSYGSGNRNTYGSGNRNNVSGGSQVRLPSRLKSGDSARVDSSRSNSNSGIAARIRETPPKLATKQTSFQSASRDRNSSEGYLIPGATSAVFNPIYFWLPFNIWHRSIAPSQSEDAGQKGAPSRERVETQDPYTDAEVGNDELNDLPAWIQASLRLMHAEQGTAVVHDFKIPILQGDENDFAKNLREQNEQMNQLKNQESQLEQTAENLALVQQSKSNVKDLESDIDFQKKFEIPSLEKSLAEAKENKANASLAVDQAKEDHFWLNKMCTFSAKLCSGVLFSTEYNAYFSAATGVNSATTNLHDGKKILEFMEGKLLRSQSSLAESLASLRAKGIDESLTEKVTKNLEVMSNKIRNRRKEIVAIAGFVHLAPDHRYKNLGDCPLESTYRYMFAADDQAPQHPFFPKVSAELNSDLAPSTDQQLLVCLNQRNQLSEVMIAQENNVIYRSKVNWTPEGFVKNITIKSIDEDEAKDDSQDQDESQDEDDSAAKTHWLEKHEWTFGRENKVRYHLEFINQNGEKTRIYTDLKTQ